LKSVADLPDGAPLKLKIIVSHTGSLEDLNLGAQNETCARPRNSVKV
jgi:hypothetical protein